MTEWIKIDEHILMSKNLVTVQEYSDFITSRGYFSRKFWSEDGWKWKKSQLFNKPAYWKKKRYSSLDMPVTGISFFEAEAFAHFTSAQLPNELVWEYIATNKGGTRFPWGDDVQDLDKRARLSFFGEFTEPGIAPINTYPHGSSPDGISDLIGNVGEWCLPRDLKKLSSDVAVLRGGSHWHIPHAIDSFFRVPTYVGTRDNQTGIRLIQWDGTPPNYSLKESTDVSIPLSIQRPTVPFRQEGIPQHISLNSYRLKISGKVEKMAELSLHDLQTQFPVTEQSGLFVCVCNWAEPNIVKGVLLKDIVEHVKPKLPLNELYIRQISIPGPRGIVYESSIPLNQSLNNNALICWEIDGKPLTYELGFPARLIDFQLYGYKQVKALNELYFTDKFEPGWWETDKGYDLAGKIQPGSATIIGKRSYKTNLQ
ncbi:MAG: SUMF1/EgtB/PvdO family nonheme iron enzyme [Nanoarchaeota archaeon]|nr:SUMF1/EgtB/PvdO family nonheme iron enzyme [Nanoarchaeota archaeon]